jgi:hypothetical protein
LFMNLPKSKALLISKAGNQLKGFEFARLLMDDGSSSSFAT